MPTLATAQTEDRRAWFLSVNSPAATARELRTWNLETGAIETIATLSNDPAAFDVRALAFDARGALHGVGRDAANQQFLLRLDPETGAELSRVPSLTLVPDREVADIAFDDAERMLLVVSRDVEVDEASIYEADPTTGSTVLLATFLDIRLTGIVSGPNGVFGGGFDTYSQPQRFDLDLDTATATPLGLLDTRRPEPGLDFDAARRLLTIGSQSSGPLAPDYYVFTVDPISGESIRLPGVQNIPARGITIPPMRVLPIPTLGTFGRSLLLLLLLVAAMRHLATDRR